MQGIDTGSQSTEVELQNEPTFKAFGAVVEEL